MVSAISDAIAGRNRKEIVGTMSGTLAAVSYCDILLTTADFRGFGEVAEWFKAAVLKTASREHRNTSQNSQSRRNPSRNDRVRDPFARNTQAQESAQ